MLGRLNTSGNSNETKRKLRLEKNIIEIDHGSFLNQANT